MNSNALELPNLEDLKDPQAIFTEVRRFILKEHHSFSDAFYTLQTKAVNDLPAVMTTDGIYLYYSPLQLSMFYRIEGFDCLLRAVLHLCSHCLLGHLPARKLARRKDIFDVLADFKVQKMLATMCNRTNERKGIKQLSLEYTNHPLKQAYQHLVKEKKPAKAYLSLAPYFLVDDHTLWDIPYSETHDEDGNPKGENGENAQNANGEGDSQGNQTKKHTRITSQQRESMRNWAKMQRNFLGQHLGIQDGLASGSLQCGGTAQGGSSGDLQSWDYDYSLNSDTDYHSILEDFLRKTVVDHENLEEIDPMWYHFGLDYLEDIPIIEPTEEDDRPREGTLVLAVDTSGSCQMTVCDRFLAELNNMMDQLQLMHSYNRVVLMQCDDKLRETIEMENADQWGHMMSSFVLQGGGGTDFRPVFDASAQYEDIVGLIFLSDTMGTFPYEPASYPTLFLVPDEDEVCPFGGYFTSFYNVPDWVQAVSF